MTQCNLGKTFDGREVMLDFSTTPHVLICGATGSGKSVLMNTIINEIIINSNDYESTLYLIDPKRVELSDFKDCRLTRRFETDVTRSISLLDEVLQEIEHRYFLFEYNHVKNIQEYRQEYQVAIQEIYVCIDELSFLMLQDKKKCENAISKIGMIGRAAGVHLILATQRPDRKTITGNIQANIDCVFGLRVRQAIESRMIIGDNRLTELKGKGDCLMINGFQEEHFQVRMYNKQTTQCNAYEVNDGYENSHLTHIN